MKKIWKFLVAHVREDFNAKQYGFAFLLIAVVLALNYTCDLNDVILKSKTGTAKFVAYFLFYSIPYYLTLLPVRYVAKVRFFKNRIFWIKSLSALALLSLDSSVPYLREWVMLAFEPDLQLWAYKVIVNLVGIFTIVIPLWIIHNKYDRENNLYYGLHPKRFDTRPYFQMLLIMLPILVAASFLPGFAKQYPMYRASEAHTLLGVSESVTISIYELAYGFDFITVELLFRGFMVIGLAQILGRHAVLSMAVIYCFLHTGKPLGEAMSSVFGGYILGVIAYETKSIWGGVIVHVGIAWMMEVIGFWQTR
jgi:hypothetical protein